MAIDKIYSDLTSGICTKNFSKMTGAKQVETVAKTVAFAAGSYILAGSIVAAFVGVGAFAYMTSQYGTFDRIRDYANQGYEGIRSKNKSLSREVYDGGKEIYKGGKKFVEEMDARSDTTDESEMVDEDQGFSGAAQQLRQRMEKNSNNWSNLGGFFQF